MVQNAAPTGGGKPAPAIGRSSHGWIAVEPTPSQMTFPPIVGGGNPVPPFRVSLLTAPVVTGIPPLVGDEGPRRPDVAPPTAAGATLRDEAPISLAGRLDTGNALPETTPLALALESATRAMQTGRPELVLTELDAVWSNQLLADSPWYLRTAALQLLGRMTDAEQVLRDAIERVPRSAALLYLLGVHTSYRGHPDAARLANDHALALHPTESLLWLQRAALASQSGMHDTAAAILARVQTMEPAFPAAQWLMTLVRLGGAATRTATPGMQRAIERLTPASLAVVIDAQAPAPTSTLSVSSLETAIRYGLTLLESPTQSARSTTHTHGAPDPSILYAQPPSRTDPGAPTRVTPPSWDAWILAAGVVVLVFVPPLRIPALMLCGAITMLIVSSRMR